MGLWLCSVVPFNGPHEGFWKVRRQVVVYGTGSPRRQAQPALHPHPTLARISCPRQSDSQLQRLLSALGRVLDVPLRASRLWCKKAGGNSGPGRFRRHPTVGVSVSRSRRRGAWPSLHPHRGFPVKVAQEAEVWAFVAAAQDFIS